MYIIKVLVQLPDGSYSWCPVVREGDKLEWAEHILPWRIRVCEEK